MISNQIIELVRESKSNEEFEKYNHNKYKNNNYISNNIENNKKDDEKNESSSFIEPDYKMSEFYFIEPNGNENYNKNNFKYNGHLEFSHNYNNK